MSYWGRVVPIVLGIGCLALATTLPTWRTTLAQVGGYSSNFLGCNTSRSGDLEVFLLQGPNTVGGFIGMNCEAALNSFAPDCAVVGEGQAIDTKTPSFGTLYRIQCGGAD